MHRSGQVALAIALAASLCSGAARADDQGKIDKAMIDAFVENLVKGFYGTFDVSIDDTTKGMGGMVAYHYAPCGNSFCTAGTKGPNIYGAPGDVPYGNVGYQPAISTNASGIGWRGAHTIPGTATKFLIQVEAQVGITASPGVVTSYTAQTQGTSGAIGLGNTFIGFGGADWGAVKVGHGVTPYKKSTDRMDPFAGMVGDMPTIMGNTGGDNRVEFNAMMEHAIWYESPRINGFSADFLFSPGQNRTADADLNLAGGSSNCNGGNVPGSGNLLDICDDGGFDNAYSLDLKFETKQLYVVVAYELHKNVNRNSDGIGSNSPIYGNWMAEGDPTAGGGGPDSQYLNWGLYNAVAAAYGAQGSCSAAGNAANYYCVNATPEFQGDIGDEAAYKVGVQYIFDFGLTVSGIFERMTRKIPAALEFQNERQRNGTWLAFTQELGPNDNINFGWAHAGKTPGDPAGQHNYNPNSTNDTADMLTFAYKHKLDAQLYWYANIAQTDNHGNAHYDLGGGGHGIKTDCHDGTTQPIIDYTSAGNTTWGGCKPRAISVGVNYKF
jgi:predicted porin